MAENQNSLAALVAMQMGGSAPALDARSLPLDKADYFWNAFSDALRRARVVSQLVTSVSAPADTTSL